MFVALFFVFFCRALINKGKDIKGKFFIGKKKRVKSGAKEAKKRCVKGEKLGKNRRARAFLLDFFAVCCIINSKIAFFRRKFAEP